MNNETLKLARNYLGLSQTALAKEIGVSQAVISNIEKSNKPLSVEVVDKLKSYFPDTFFRQRMFSPNLKVHYRSSANIAKKYTELFESRLLILANNIGELLEYVNIPKNNIPKKDLEDFRLNPEYLANEIRNYFNLGISPIENIISLLEKNGVIIYFFDFNFISAQNKNFDGVSFYASGVPVILINDKIQNARKVFTIAHELGHLIMHNHNDFIISNERDIEKEANVFASEFLAPKIALRGEFARLSMEKLFLLKSYWKVSLGALLYKAKEMTLTKDQYRRWITRLAPYRKEEPRDFYLPEPVLLSKMVNVCKQQIGEEAFLEDLGLSKKIYSELYSTIIKPERNKLKIVL